QPRQRIDPPAAPSHYRGHVSDGRGGAGAAQRAADFRYAARRLAVAGRHPGGRIRRQAPALPQFTALLRARDGRAPLAGGPRADDVAVVGGNKYDGGIDAVGRPEIDRLSRSRLSREHGNTAREIQPEGEPGRVGVLQPVRGSADSRGCDGGKLLDFGRALATDDEKRVAYVLRGPKKGAGDVC